MKHLICNLSLVSSMLVLLFSMGWLIISWVRVRKVIVAILINSLDATGDYHIMLSILVHTNFAEHIWNTLVHPFDSSNGSSFYFRKFNRASQRFYSATIYHWRGISRWWIGVFEYFVLVPRNNALVKSWFRTEGLSLENFFLDLWHLQLLGVFYNFVTVSKIEC